MARVQRIRLVPVLSFLLLMAAPREARAYVDPGSGAMIWQVALAALIGLTRRRFRLAE